MRRTVFIEDKKYTELSPCDFGREDCEPRHRFGPFVRSYYLLHFIKGGCGTYTSPRGTHALGAGSAFIIRPGEVTVYEADAAEPWEYVWIGFRGRLAERFAELGDSFIYSADILRELEYALNIEIGREEYLAGVLFKLYATVFGNQLGTDHTAKVAAYINAHYMEPITIAGIADMLSLDRKYLARIFKERRGVSMQQYLINKRLYEARRLLEEGYTVAETAAMVGYCDQFAFSKAFRGKYNVAPSAVRCAAAQ